MILSSFSDNTAWEIAHIVPGFEETVHQCFIRIAKRERSARSGFCAILFSSIERNLYYSSEISFIAQRL